MDTYNQICVPEELISPKGLDPAEEFEVFFLIEAASADAPGKTVEIPDIPIEVVLSYMAKFSSEASDKISLVKGFIDAEVMGSHTAIRGVAETLRRDLVYAASLYDKAGRKVTPEIRTFVENAQASARKSLSNVRLNTRSYRLLTENDVSLQFGAITKPWSQDVRKKLTKIPPRIYSLADLAKNPEVAINKQAYFRNTQQVLVFPKSLSNALKGFDTVLAAVEIAPSVYDLYSAVEDGDLEKGLLSILNASAILGSKAAGEVVTRIGFSLCVETGIAVTVLASPAIGLPFTLACGVGAVVGGIYLGDWVKTLPTKLTPVQNINLRAP